MAALTDFNINESLRLYLSDPLTIQTPEAESALTDSENGLEDSDAQTVNRVINAIVDQIAESPDAILRSSNLDSLQLLLKSSNVLSSTCLAKIADLVISGLSAEADNIIKELDSDEIEDVSEHKLLLEIYAFLMQWTLTALEAKASERSSSGTASNVRGKCKGAKASKVTKDDLDVARHVQTALDTMGKVLKMRLNRIFLTSSEKDTFVSLFTRAVYLILENEAHTKSMPIKMHCFKVLCICIKHHGHSYGAQTSIIQNLSYFEHLSEPMAELLHILAEQYDFPQLVEEILKELSAKEFNSNDAKGPRSISTFIAKLSELVPRLVIRQMTLLARLLDSDSYTLRCAIIEVCGNLIAMLSKEEAGEQTENHKKQINAFFDVLEERFLDMNPYCRCRVFQVYVKLCDLDTKFPKKRQTAVELATRSLEDKSSNVRRNAIKLLAKLIQTHPFSVLHGGQLSHEEWQERLETVQKEIDSLQPPENGPGLGEQTGEKEVDESLLDEATQFGESGGKAEVQTISDEQKEAAIKKAAEDAATSEAIGKLQLTRRYYTEAMKFIEVLHEASPIICQLLMSKNKSEVIEAMDFFMIADAYRLAPARAGIRKMLLLIWMKGNSDEGKGVQSHLIECYKAMFFDAPDNFSANDAANYVARNMISLTFGASTAELTSLEQLLCTMMKSDMISALVVEKLWQVYGVQRREISKNQRRGAIMVLSMLALADPMIILQEMESILRIGLGMHGKADLNLAKHSCIALARIKPTKHAKQNTAMPARLPNDHIILAKLAEMAEMASDSKEWYGAAEQAINAIYTLSKHPDILCSEIIKRKTRTAFQLQTSKPVTESDSTAEDANMSAAIEDSRTALSQKAQDDNTRSQETPKKAPTQRAAGALAQLLFIVGHVAVKQIVHLELCEQHFKKRKAEKEKEKATPVANTSPSNKKPNEPTAEEELDLIGGTTEDDFTEAIAHIREREILFGSQSILSNFGPLVQEICSNNTAYKDETLQAVATICMAKLMCVSSEYCERNLPLLITIMERSEDPVTRSNVVIALGDMAVCFNNLIDENTDFLYRRLNDTDVSVKRTCLMTLTFLILAGQVKVKGQLGIMAKCLEDSDKRIADLSRMFFTELATKDNAVYNQFVDMFSVLSADSELEHDAFKKIIKFLASFIEKDKHAKQLAQKLAARLPRCDTEAQWNDVAYVLGLLQHKDEEITKVVNDGFKIVQAAA